MVADSRFRASGKVLCIMTGLALGDRDLERDLGPVPPFGPGHYAMSGRIRVFAGHEQV